MEVKKCEHEANGSQAELEAWMERHIKRSRELGVSSEKFERELRDCVAEFDDTEQCGH